MSRMSNFATALDTLMVQKELNQAKLAHLSGIPQAQISRFINTPNQWISDEDFERLCKVFTKPIEQANLIHARLLDNMASMKVPGAKLVNIQIAGENQIKEEAAPYQTKLPPKLDKDIQTVIEHIGTDRLVREMISSLAVHLRRKQ
jgi:DNA-binding Xre family transcriptional regulator